jgi:hypothetical protein
VTAERANVLASGGGLPPGGVAGVPLAGAYATALGRPALGPVEAVACGETVPEQPVRLGDVTDTEFAGGEAAPATMLSAGVFSGVLGRPVAGVTVPGNNIRKDSTRKEAVTATEDDEVLVERLAAVREDQRPETVSAPVPPEPANLVRGQESVAAVTAEIPAVQSAPARGSIAIPDFGRTELAATTEGTVDPKERGMHVPASATSGGGAELATAQEGALPLVTPMAAPVSPAAAAPAGAGHGMGPMMPPMMMGGMGGMGGRGGDQNGERFAEVPVTPEAEVWDPQRATGAVLGRPEPDPEPSALSEPCSEQEIDAVRQAALDKILGKRS